MCVVCLTAQPAAYVERFGSIVCSRCWFHLTSPEQTQLELFEGGGGEHEYHGEVERDIRLLEEITPPPENRGGEAPSDMLPF